MRPRQYSLSVISLLLLSQEIFFVFVAAKQKNTLRGLFENKEPGQLDELPFGSANDISLTKDKLVRKNDKDSTESPSELPSSYPTQTPTRKQKENDEKVDERGDKGESDIDPDPTIAPTAADPTRPPTTAKPTVAPTDMPFMDPTDRPTAPPTDAVVVVTNTPTRAPIASIDIPSMNPTDRPTAPPTDAVVVVTNTPTRGPIALIDMSFLDPTDRPTAPPTDVVVVVTNTPTRSPIASIDIPSVNPTDRPTAPPTDVVVAVTNTPTRAPSSQTTINPTALLTPSSSPIFEATSSPSLGVRVVAASKSNTTASDSTEYPSFVVEEELPEIIIDMTVDNFTQTVNCMNKLEKYFIDFIEGILGMSSSNEWYSYHLKSVGNISIELVSDVYVEENNDVLPAKKLLPSAVPVGFSQPIPIPIRLTINGLVVVRFKEYEGEEEMSLKESLCHNMLMYMSFWGVEKMQNVLEEGDCFQNPIINLIIVGEKEIPTVVIAGDSMYNDDHDSNRPKQPLLPGSIIDGSSSPVTVVSSKFASVVIIMVSGGILLMQYW
jgi:hypothetical protein